MSTPEDNTIRALLDEQAAHAATKAERDEAIARRNVLHDALRRMGATLAAAGQPAGFSPDEVEQASAAALADLAVIRDELTASEASNAALRAELDALRARTAKLIAAEVASDPRDPPVDTCDCAERTAEAEQRLANARRLNKLLVDDIIDGRRR